jgi:23S rRNA (cytidine1920-2'-O)/16S rRNA (cytidine1409-2'-O)-methyltransferase
LDSLLYARGLVDSREKARAMIIAGEVRVNGLLVDKPGTRVDETSDFHIEPRRQRYVSRGGFKLEGAIGDFDIDFQKKVVLDVGASTGGYTDCALQNGAAKVFALDVGYGQLDWGLRNDPRVKVIERTNIRYFTPEKLGELVDIVTMDVSFISTRLIYPVLSNLLKEHGEVVSLIKPQFEAGKDKVGKNGVVKDSTVHQDVLRHCIEVAREVGLDCVGISYSPIKGPKGNIEYFIHLKKKLKPLEELDKTVEDVVLKAHSILEGKAR